MSSRRLSRRAVPIAAFTLLALGSACSGGDSSTSAAGGTSTRATADRADRGDDSGREADLPTPTSGTGAITVAGATYAFTSDSCAIGAGDPALLEIRGAGSAGGREYNVEILRSKPASNVVETVKLAFSGVEASLATRIASPEEAAFKVEDGKVAATGLSFTGAGGAPGGDGGLAVTCGSPGE